MIKKIDCIIRPSKIDEIKEKLAELGVEGMTVSEVKGCGIQKGHTEDSTSGAVELRQKMRIEIVTEEEKVEKIINIVQSLAGTGKIGDGKIFVIPVEDVVRVRTKERGTLAIT